MIKNVSFVCSMFIILRWRAVDPLLFLTSSVLVPKPNKLVDTAVTPALVGRKLCVEFAADEGRKRRLRSVPNAVIILK